MTTSLWRHCGRRLDQTKITIVKIKVAVLFEYTLLHFGFYIEDPCTQLDILLDHICMSFDEDDMTAEEPSAAVSVDILPVENDDDASLIEVD